MLKKTALIFLVLSMVFVGSCAGNTSDGEKPAETTARDNGFDGNGTEQGITEEQLLEYSVVYGADASDGRIARAAKLVGDKISKVPNESGAAVTAKEILIGNTDRLESAVAAKLLENTSATTAYAITVVDGVIAICGNTNDALIYGVKYFIGTFLSGTGETLGADYTRVYETNNSVTVYDNLTVLEITSPSQIFGATKTEYHDTDVSYPKVIRLEHSGKNNGTLIATQESVTSGTTLEYVISRSTDDGETWKKICVIKDTTHKNMYANWQPYIYELPEQIGDMPEGTLLLAGCTHDWGGSSAEMVKTHICLYKSTNGGISWKHISDIASSYYANYKGDGTVGNGVWEPVLIVENGKLMCFYSDENDADNHSQRLVYKISDDGVTWNGEVYEAIALESSGLRPGMLSFVKLKNGKYFATYEIVGLSGGPIYYRIVDSLTDWGDVSAFGTPLISTKGRKTIGTSPWVGYAPVGENGMLFVTAEHMITGDDGKGVYIFASFDYGETWLTIENPMPYPTVEQQTGSYGYSSCFFTSEDGHTVYFAEGTQWDYPENGNKSVNKMVKFLVW